MGRLLTCFVLVLALGCSPFAADAQNATQATAKPAEGLSGEDLAQKVLAAAEAQDFREDTPEKVVSAVVKEAPAAELANGDGDISTTGDCAADIDAICLNTPPGEGRLASCIQKRVQDEDNGNVTGRKVAPACKKALSVFFQDRATNVNKNLQLATACKADIEKLCKNLDNAGSPGAVLACLRSKQGKLNVICGAEVLKAKLTAANDFAADPTLYAACKDDAASICADVPAGNGRVQACLRRKSTEIHWDCREELFRQEMENADDIRLNVRLFNACRADQLKFCKDVAPGSNRVKDCLEEKREEAGFSSECKKEFEEMMSRRASDFRLDSNLREACASDIQHICGYEANNLESVEGYDARVITCLQDFKGELVVEECKAAVHKVMERASTDIRFDEPLMDSCVKDREQFCATVVPGSARVIRCLQDNRDKLTYQCRAQLFDHEVRMAEDIDFQYPLKKACASELKTLCTKVEKGHARLIRCLHRKVDERAMGMECKREVRRNMNRMAQDYRLNFRLHKACDADVSALCSDVCAPYLGQACGGSVLRCLQDKMEKIGNEDCKAEVFYFVKMEVTDFRNDVMLAEACRSDVDSFCKDVEAGEGRVLECLREHRSSLSDKCRKEELNLSQLQAKDVRLRPRLMKLCGEEMVVFCKGITPGAGRMFTCLLENVQKTGFSTLCRDEVVKREDLMKSDYRLDGGVSINCATDIEAHCKAEAAGAHGHAEVLKCLVGKIMQPEAQVSDACQTEISRAVRMAFWDFKVAAALTEPCDQDVQTICPKKALTNNRGVYTIGVVGRCLSKQLAEMKPMSPGCRQLVTVAAPKDIRLYIQDSINPDGTPKLGFLATAYDQVASGSFITLSGWVAVLSIAALAFLVTAGAVWGYRRFTGLDKPYTQLVAPGKSDVLLPRQ